MYVYVYTYTHTHTHIYISQKNALCAMYVYVCVCLGNNPNIDEKMITFIPWDMHENCSNLKLHLNKIAVRFLYIYINTDVHKYIHTYTRTLEKSRYESPA